MFNPVIVLLFCYVSSVLASNPAETINLPGVKFSKQTGSYVRVVNKEKFEAPINDYVSTVAKLLEDIKCNVTVSADDLSKFSDGFSQYYLSKAHQYYHTELKPVAPVINVTEPVCLPNVTAEGTPEIVFYDVKVYGFPPFKANYAVISNLSSDPYFQGFEISFKAPADTVIFTGSFCIYQKSYYFVYVPTTNEYQSKHLKVRNGNGLIESKTIEDSFSFVTEPLSHTFDSSLDHYAEVKEFIFPKFVTALESVYLPTLAVTANAIITSKFHSTTSKFTEIYRQKILDLLVQAAIQSATLKGFNNFHSRPLSFTNLKAAEHNRTATITYDNITVEGLLNYVKYEFSSPSQTANGSIVHMSDKIIFTYPESGDKVASLCFTIKLYLKDTVRRHRIKRLILESAYIANLTQYPPQISPNTEAFDLKNAIKVKLDVDSEDDPYYFIIIHASHDLTRAVNTLVFGTQYPE